jgi:hypothetical protein
MQRYGFSVRIGGFLSENIVVELLVELLMSCRVGSGGLVSRFCFMELYCAGSDYWEE